MTLQELDRDVEGIKKRIVLLLGESIVEDLKSTPKRMRRTLKIKLVVFSKLVDKV